MTTPVRALRLVTPIMRSQTALLQPRYTSLIKPIPSTTNSARLTPAIRSFTSPSAPRQASPAASHTATASHDSHDSHGHHGHGASEDRSGPDFGLHFHEASKWHQFGAKFFGGLLWFWLLYRLKNDWRFYFFWDNPFDAHDDGHGEGHGHDEHKAKQH